ncbi:hypothetical protein MOVS_05240 [Moraxella ovis]|uniref:Membrane-bound lytic murein transglycosylase D n=1 Tax=Moraxella ovis TaxID=29433 RepID=A0A378PK13_9GAMM|nr:transglycosylase SLT domain-containing protein [Moraxella ovis]ANB91483.1 hypothetical protein MOVS_05240 [Moraxella ovis]STY87101.1 Membrane-bound lytic murein transglycosylase D precursor [Moraxella ovis]
MTDSTKLSQARQRQIVNVNNASNRLTITPQSRIIPTTEQDRLVSHIEDHYAPHRPNTTGLDTISDALRSVDLGVNSGVNNVLTGLYGSTKAAYDNFSRLVNTPVVGATALLNGEDVSGAIKESWGYEYTPSTQKVAEALENVGLVSTHKYAKQVEPYLSDTLRYDKNQLDKASNTGSEVQDLKNTLTHYYSNPRHLAMTLVQEVGDMGTSALMGSAVTKGAGLGGKISAALVGEGLSSYGNASNELMQRGVNPDTLNGVLTAGSIAGVNMLTQKVLNTKYSPENIADNLLKSTASSVGKFGKPTNYVGGVVIGAGSEALEEALHSSYETGAINYASGMPITQGMGRAVGEGVAIGGTLGGASSAIGGLNEPLPIKEDNSKPNLGKLFTQAQAINKQKTQKINDVASQYNISTISTSNKVNKENPIQVAIMGDYSKKDTGKGTNDHYDLRLARDANGKRGDINPYLDRFIVNGKPLNSYKQTGKYMEQRTGYKHEGVDYGFNGSFGKDANARNLFINPKYEVTNITAFDNNKHGGGWVTQVTFSDGIKVNILHQNKEGALSIADAFKQRKSVGSSHYIKHKNLNLGATPYDDLMKEIYTKYGYTEQEQRILKAQLAQESAFNPNAKSPAGAKGIAQFLDATAKQYGVNVNDVASSIDGQARFMRDLLKRSNGNWEMALAFYNAGAGSTDAQTRFNKVKNIKETNQYYNNILANAGVDFGGTSIDTANDTNNALNELNNLLSQWEQEEVNTKNEEGKAKLQEQIDTLKNQLAEITGLEQQEQEIKEQGKQIFAGSFNDKLTELEIDVNPFLDDTEKAEYKKQLGILRGDETNIDASEPSTIKPKTYDEIEQEYVINTPNSEEDGTTNPKQTELINNEPTFTQRFSLSNTTPEEIDSNPKLTDNQKRAIHKMMDVQRQVANTRDVQGVTDDILIGSVGNTTLESNRGLQDYITGFENAINANNIKAASNLLTDLGYLRDTRVSKNNAINQALQLVQDSNIKDINDAPIIAQDADTKEWFVTEYTGLREAYPEFDGSNALTVFKPNKLTEQISKEAKLVDDFTNAWADYLADYNTESAQIPTLDTSMSSVTSKATNRATRSYDEAEATFKGREFTQERVKSELPPLTETSKNSVDVKAGKIQLVQDVSQVPEDGTFLGRGRYTDESGKSRPSSMYDMEQGRINIGDSGWLASPYNPPKQGYKPNPFTLADSKPSTHAEAYGSYFKRMFMKHDDFAKAVLELEPNKLYRTKYSTTEAQYIDNFLQNVPRESVEDARAWMKDKVYGIEKGKPAFNLSKNTVPQQDEANSNKNTKVNTKANSEVKSNNVVDNTPVDTSEESTNLKLDKGILASFKAQLTGKEAKTESNVTKVEDSPVDISDELTDLKLDKDTLASVKSQLTDKPVKTESNDTKTKDTPIEVNTKETNTDNNEIASKSNEPSLTGFKKESTTVNTVFNITPEQVEQEKSKHWQSQNHLILGFKQEADKPLVSILNLASNLENNLTTGIEELLPNIKATEAQIKQVNHFLAFNKAFVKALKNSYHKEAIGADGRDYSFRDFKGYLQKEDGSFDENTLTALSLSAYSHFIANNKDSNSYKDIGKLLNYPEDISIPSELLSKYKYVGDRYNNTVNSIGRTAYELLGLKTNKDVSELYRGRMIASLGNWVISSLVNVGLMYETTISNDELKKDSYALDSNDDNEAADDHSIVTFLSFTTPDGEGKKKLLDDITEINKGTQGFLAKLFGGDVGLRSPTLEPTDTVNRDIRGTTAKVSNTQAKLQKHMQQEPIVINKDSINSLQKLVEKFPEQAKTMIGAYISKDTLDDMHESKRVGAEAKAEGNNRELERLIGFTSGLKRDEEGNYQEFFDSNYVTKNNRGQYNSNEVNMQTMKIHRAMVDYKNFEQVIEADVLNNLTGTETDFVVDGQLTDLGHLFSAVAENAEGTEDVIKSMLNNLTYRRGFTVDKVRAEDFLPAFFEHLETDEAVQTAVTSTQKLLEDKELNQSDMDNIQTVVDAWAMQALSFRALVEYAKFKQAQKDNTDLITSFGLGADGVNNGSAISYTLMGLMVNKENPDLMNQIGVFTEESGFSNFHETRLKGLNDYYEGLGTIMEKELSTYKPDRKLRVNLFYRINPSIQGRQGAKEVLIPAGYGAGVKRLLEVAFESLIRDVTNSYESLHNTHKSLEANKSSMSEAEYNRELEAFVDDYNELQDDLRAALNDREFNLPHPSDMLNSDVFLTKQQQKKLKDAYNDVIGGIIIESFNKYSKSFNEARRANIRFHEASANIYLTLHKTQLDKALEAKKEKIKESLNTTHKKLVQDRLTSINARRAKDKEPLTYEDMLETMATDQLEFEGLTKQEYKEQVEKPLLKVYPTVNTAFNYAEPKHKRKLSDIRILKSKTITVDVSDSYQMKTIGADGKVKYKKASVLTQEWVSAAVAPNSAQVQGVDARVAFEAAAMNGDVSLNVHDNVIAGRRNYVSMVRVLNKKFYETTRDYHANLASVNAFLDTLDGLVNIREDIGEEVFNETMIESLIDFLNMNSKEKEEYLDATDGEFDKIISDVRPRVINEVEMAINRDILKIQHYEKVNVVHQYAGYGGQYELTAEDKAKEKEELEKLEKIQKSVKAKVTTLLARLSKPNNSILSNIPTREELKELEIEANEHNVEISYRYNKNSFGERSNLRELPDIPVVKIKTKQLGFKDTKKLADEILRQIQKTDGLYNKDTGWVLQVGKKDRKKMGNNKELSHTTSQSVQGIEELVTNAVVAETHEDIKHQNTDVIAVHRLYVPALINGNLHRVKLTVKDYILTDGLERKNLHAIEAVEIETSVAGNSTTQPVGSSTNHNGSKLSITTLLKGVKHDGDDGIFFGNQRKIGFKDLEIEQQEQSLPKPYSLNQLQKSVGKLRDDSAEFKLFDYLISVAKNNKGLAIIMTEDFPSEADGMYDNKTNTIYLRPSIMSNNELSADRKIRLINHELLHALTETGIRLGKEKGSKAYKDMQKMYEQIKQKANGQYTKELADMNEFIAYGLTDVKFRAFIADNLDTRTLGIKSSKIQSALDTFLKAVYSILGFNTSHNFNVFAKTVDALIVPYEPIQGTGVLRHSASAMKSNKANIQRGIKAMNQVITTKADKKRAMYRNDIGWIDFVWGSTGVLKANGKTKGAMGISHIIEARMRKDGMDYREVTRMLTEDIVKTIALGVEYKRNIAPDGKSSVLKIRHNGYEANLVKNLGNNAWVLTGYELHDKDVPNGGDRVGGDTSNPTHITPTRTRDNVGAFGTFKESDGDIVKSIGSSTSTHTTPTLHRDGMGASDKNSIAPKDIPFKQRYSQSDITSDMSTVEVIQSLDSSMIGSEHNQRLNDLTQRIIGTFGMNSNQDTIVDNDKILQSDALLHGFKMSDKEIAVYNSLHAVFTAMENHRANQNYQSLVKLYSDAKKQLSYKDFLTTDRPTSEDALEAKRKYEYVFNSEEHLNDRIAVFASLGLANEEMAKVLQKPRQVKQREAESWFDKLMTIFDKVFKALTEQAFFKGGKDFQSQLDVLSNKLLKVDADVRANKRALHEIAWQGVGLMIKPLNKAVHLAMGLAVKQASKLEGSSNPHLDSIGKISREFARIKEKDNQVYMTDIVNMINESSSRGRFNEVRELVNEATGIVGNTSKVVMEKVLRLTQNIGRGREKHRKAVIKNIRSYFPNKGKDLTVDETSAVTRVLLRTDVSSLLNDDNQAEVLKLITDDKHRQSTIEELHSLVSSFNLSKPKTNGIIMSAMDLAAYLAKEEVPNNLYKNAEGIARFYGQEGNIKLIEAIDKLATLQALEYVDRVDLDTAKHMMKSYPDAMWNVLNLHKAYTTISKEQEFKYNKYSYQKGYLPQDTNSLRSLVYAKSMDEVLKLQDEGWELLTQSPDGMKQDSADLTTPKYLMFHKNSNYRNYNSGALDMKDTHAKGSVIYTYRDHKDITRYIKDKDALMIKRNTTVNPKDYNPFKDTGNMVMAYDPYGAIINVHYEMRGATRDKYLERNNNFIDLMGLYVSGIDAKPLLMEQQANVAKVLYQDYKLNYKQRPYEFIVLDPRSKDEKTLETLRMMPYSFRAEAERLFGKGEPIVVKKSVFLMTFGYRQLSIGDLFDKHFDDLGAFSKAFVISSKAILGNKAKGRLMIAEYFVSRLTSLANDFVVIRNPEVLKGNIISNSLMLMLRGVNPVDVIKESIRVWKQGRDYVELENELNDLRVKYQTVKDKTQIEKEMRDIFARMERHPLSVYFKQGLMSSIVEDVKIDDRDTYGSIWEEKFDEYKDKLIPKKVQEGIDFVMMNRGSPLHNMMTHATQFSDFSAKVILIEHLKKQGMSEKQAIAEAQDVFINFDIPTGPVMDYANRMGLMRFTKFFVRFQKAMVRALGKTPASTLLQHTLVEQFTDQAGILDPFALNRLGNNPFDLAPLSLPSVADDILTLKMVDAMIPDVF